MNMSRYVAVSLLLLASLDSSAQNICGRIEGVDYGDRANAPRPLVIGQTPIASDPIASLTPRESDQYAWSPSFEPGPVTFDSFNRPYIRLTGSNVDGGYTHSSWDRGTYNTVSVAYGASAPGTIQTLRGCQWVTLNYFKDIQREYGPEVELTYKMAHAITPTVVIDKDDSLYMLASGKFKTVSRFGSLYFNALMHSRDHGHTWSVKPIDFRYPDASGSPIAFHLFLLEQSASPDALPGPPALVLYSETGLLNGGAAPDQFSNHGKLYLIAADKAADGSLAFHAPVLLSEKAMYPGIHSGGSSMVATVGNKVVVLWGEVTSDPAQRAIGSPIIARSYDKVTRQLAAPQTVHHSRRANDNHNMSALLNDSKGGLDVITGAHNDEIFHVKGTRLSDGSYTWSAATKLSNGQGCTNAGMVEGCRTYISFVRDHLDGLHVAFREIRRDPLKFGGVAYAALNYQRKTAFGAWENSREIVVPPLSGYSIYHQRMNVDRLGRIFLSYSYWSQRLPYLYESKLRSKVLLTSRNEGQTWTLAGSDDFVSAKPAPIIGVAAGRFAPNSAKHALLLRKDSKYWFETRGLRGADSQVLRLTDGVGTFMEDQQQALMSADFNGDGVDEAASLFRHWLDGSLKVRIRSPFVGLGSLAIREAPLSPALAAGEELFRTFSGDYSGDGKADILILVKDVAAGMLKARYFEGSGNFLFVEKPVAAPLLQNLSGYSVLHILQGRFTDLTRNQLALLTRNANENTGALTVKILRLTTTDSPVSTVVVSSKVFTDGAGVHEYPALAGDFDGDGYTDIGMLFHHWTTGKLTLRTRFFNAAGFRSYGEGSLDENPAFTPVVLDQDADGKEDLVLISRDAASGEIVDLSHRSLGAGTFAPAVESRRD